MTPKERILAFFSGQPTDFLPCCPLILNHASRILGVTIRDYTLSGVVMGRAHVAAYRRYGHDLITLFSDTAVLAEAMGTGIYFPEDAVPRVEQPAVAEPSDAKKLGAVDARKAARLPVYLDAIRHCNRQVGDQVLTACCFAAPFTTAACLRGTEYFARDLLKNPDLAMELLEKSLKVTNDFSEAVVEASGIPVLVDPVASGSVISRKVFERFAMPYLTRALAKIGSLGQLPILHICGDSTGIVDLMAETGAAALSLDKIGLAEAKAKVGDKVCLMGNVRPAETLLDGTPEMVYAEARQCIADAGNSPRGFVLSSGCEVPADTPPENVEALIAAARA